jgi:polyhydroxybutyrate depolymerase
MQPSAAGELAAATAGGQNSLAGTGGAAAVVGVTGVAAGGMSGASGAAGHANPAGASAAAGSGGVTPNPTGGTGGAAPVTCPATVLAPGEATTSIQVGGVSRTFILHVPQSYNGKTAVPLVIDWHGLGSSGSGQESVSGYKTLSDAEGFVIAWPNGIDNGWNIGPCCTKSTSVDDLGFATALVANIEGRACIDPKRVYSTGYSMGGGMSQYLGCHEADVFAAIAPAAFDLLIDSEEPCMPSRQISVILFRGTSDPLVPYNGGASMPPNGLNVTIHFLSATDTLKKWADLDGCTVEPMDTGNGCQTYSQCKDGTEVTLCTKQGGGHDPGDAKQGWAMLKKHPMP